MEKELTPHDYFLQLKSNVESISNEKLKQSFNNICFLSEKYKKTGQIKSLEKLKFLAEVMQKEVKLLEIGVDKFIYRSVIEDYIDNVTKDVVKIQDLESYQREIPDEIVEVIEKTKDIFDKFYVVFTDYTGQEERKVEQERRDRDPILFGVFTDRKVVSDRFYYLGDWEDEFCDLTLDKLVAEYKANKHQDPTLSITMPATTDELINTLKQYTETNKSNTPDDIHRNNNHFTLSSNRDLSSNEYFKKNKGFFGRIKSIFSKNEK